MNKYIDAEKLIAELERKISVCEKQRSDAIEVGCQNLADDASARMGELYVVLETITSLQQDKETLELCAKIWWEEQGWIMIPPDVTVEGIESLLRQVRKILQQEQPGVDLEKELDQWRHDHFKGKRDGDYSGEYLERESQLDLARHFYELGLNTRKEENK